ncbi:MAG TPA: TRAP transporter small permease [Beijerinckiaceae bacterium]|nr:TRAP transporter small permease [Beijerinckiaceae bacterium]
MTDCKPDLLSSAMSFPPCPPSGLRRLEWQVVWLNAALVLAITALMVVLVVGNVFFRYVLNASLIWAEELSQYLMVWMVFLGAGLAFRQGRHVAVEMLQDALPGPTGRMLRWVVLVISAVFLALLVVLGTRYALFAAEQQTPALQISAAVPYSAVPFGAALFLFHLVMAAPAFVEKRYEEMGSLEQGEES